MPTVKVFGYATDDDIFPAELNAMAESARSHGLAVDTYLIPKDSSHQTAVGKKPLIALRAVLPHIFDPDPPILIYIDADGRIVGDILPEVERFHSSTFDIGCGFLGRTNSGPSIMAGTIFLRPTVRLADLCVEWRLLCCKNPTLKLIDQTALAHLLTTFEFFHLPPELVWAETPFGCNGVWKISEEEYGQKTPLILHRQISLKTRGWIGTDPMKDINREDYPGELGKYLPPVATDERQMEDTL
jgi:hypothetical protein